MAPRGHSVACVVALFALLSMVQICHLVKYTYAGSVAYRSCPARLPSCQKCPTGDALPELSQIPNSIMPIAKYGAMKGGAFVGHPGQWDTRQLATKLDSWGERDLFSIEECCNLCTGNRLCGYWNWRQSGKENKGTCNTYSTEQCSSSPALAKYAKWRSFDTINVISFKKCAVPAATRTTSSQNPTASSPPPSPPPLSTSSIPSPSTNDDDASGTPAATLSPPPPSPPPSLQNCPNFPKCANQCPDASNVPAILAGSDTSVLAGQLTPLQAPATGWTLLDSVPGWTSMGECCQQCSDRWQEDCWLWNWKHDPIPGNADRGRCRLFTSSTCSFMTDNGWLNQDVWDPTQPGYYAYATTC